MHVFAFSAATGYCARRCFPDVRLSGAGRIFPRHHIILIPIPCMMLSSEIESAAAFSGTPSSLGSPSAHLLPALPKPRQWRPPNDSAKLPRDTCSQARGISPRTATLPFGETQIRQCSEAHILRARLHRRRHGATVGPDHRTSGLEPEPPGPGVLPPPGLTQTGWRAQGHDGQCHPAQDASRRHHRPTANKLLVRRAQTDPLHGRHRPAALRAGRHPRGRPSAALRPGPRASRLWNEFIECYHYLGYKTLVDAQMRYAIKDRNGCPLATLGFSTAAWKIAPRDRFIGWPPQTRAQDLTRICDNARFLILPWIRIPNLAPTSSPSPGSVYPKTGNGGILRRDPALPRNHLPRRQLDPCRRHLGLRTLRHQKPVRAPQKGNLALSATKRLEAHPQSVKIGRRHAQTERLQNSFTQTYYNPLKTKDRLRISRQLTYGPGEFQSEQCEFERFSAFT